MQLAQADKFKLIDTHGMTSTMILDIKRWAQSCESGSNCIELLCQEKYGGTWKVYSYVKKIKLSNNCNDKYMKLKYAGKKSQNLRVLMELFRR